MNTDTKIFIACDHAAFEEKQMIIGYLNSLKGYTVEDLGTHTKDSVAYPVYAQKLCETLLKNQNQDSSRGILMCGSGIGVSMAANRYKGIRAARCVTVNDAKLSREHNNANVLCLGSRINSVEELIAMTKIWLQTDFLGGRHQERVDLF